MASACYVVLCVASASQDIDCSNMACLGYTVQVSMNTLIIHLLDAT